MGLKTRVEVEGDYLAISTESLSTSEQAEITLLLIDLGHQCNKKIIAQVIPRLREPNDGAANDRLTFMLMN